MSTNTLPSVSVVIPVRNEVDSVPELIKRLEKTLKKTTKEYELIFIDDHSTDGTAEKIISYTTDPQIRYYVKKKQLGKAQSLIEGFSYASYDLFCMIDADLQYPPEAIPKMIEKIQSGKSDVVVADRTSVETNIIRRSISRSFNYIFCQKLHGLNVDVQSGLKVFRKEIVKRIVLQPFPWTFDLEFLLEAQAAGYKVDSVDITFAKRLNGSSKINIVFASLQIGFAALWLKFKPQNIIQFDDAGIKKDGKGFHFKKVKFVHYSNLSLTDSAVKTLFAHQIAGIIIALMLLIVGLILNWVLTVTICISLITVLYFIDLLFNFVLIYRSFTKSPEIKISKEQIEKVTEWPLYTIFCPLYREWNVVPQFVKAIDKLDYPKNKLQVQLLLEEDDVETIEKVKEFDLPSYFKVVIVPDTLPKTKPKACNYGLMQATGKYAVIYDAEDMPDKLQLKKAVVAFEQSEDKIACIQAKLNYYNQNQNLLTRLFTAEYSLWFDLILTGLQSLKAPIPLGGTSNHFRVDKLREVKGWDSFNVTEDCDLGIRLAKKGYQTAIIDSVTLEEANSDFFNWINQRSRWIKGYIQTYLVHMRYPRNLLKGNFLPHFLTFQLVVGGKIFALFVNPMMWIMTIAYFTLQPLVGLTIEKFFPGPILYMGVFSLIFGNFLYMYYYMIGCANRKQYELIKYVYLVPLYWIGMSIAAWKGLIQLFFNPHYWPKTKHGLHFHTQKEQIKQNFFDVIIEHEVSHLNGLLKRFNVRVSKNKLIGGLYVIGTGVASFLNFLYNAYLGRVLDFSDFALIGLIGGFLSLTTIITSSFNTTINYKSSYIIGKRGLMHGMHFWKEFRKKGYIIGVTSALIWLGITPFLISYFNVHDYYPFLLFMPILVVGLMASADRGFISARFMFGSLALLSLIDPIVKLSTAYILVQLGLKHWAYAAIPLAILIVYLFGWHFARSSNIQHKIRSIADDEKSFPFKFFMVTVLSGFAVIAFVNLDVIFAKHYLDSIQAGQYALISLVGKMIFFLGALVAPFTIPLVSRREGAKVGTENVLYMILFLTFMFVLPAFIILGVFAPISLPFLFGDKTLAIVPYAMPLTFAITCFTLSKVFIDYHLVKRNYMIPFASFVLSLLQVGALALFHDNVQEIVYIVSAMWIANLVLMVVLHFNSEFLKKIERRIVRFFDMPPVYSALPRSAENNLKILIFNWRDTKHRWSGGAEVYIHELAKRWVKNGNHVTIFCGNDRHCKVEDMIDGVHIVRRGGFYLVYVWAFLYYIFKFRGKYDVIIDSENGIPFFTPLYAREKKFLLIHHVHQEVFRKSLKWPLAPIASALEAKLMPFVYRHTQVITVSPSSKKEIMKHKLTKKDPIIIFNGVDHEIFKKGEKSSKPTILYLGRLQYYKSLHIFIKAAKKVIKNIPDASFIIAGEGEEQNKLKRLTRKLHMAKYITFTGKVSQDEKLKLFQKSWIFVNPSFMEGWGITTIEANACGTPAVASDVPGLRDSIQNNKTGFLIPYGNVNAFAAKIEKLIRDEKLRKQVSKKAQTWSEDFAWDKSANQFYAIMLHDLVDMNEVMSKLSVRLQQ